MQKIIIVLSAIGITGVLAYFYLSENYSKDNIVVLKLEETEFKKKPENPGGIVMPNSDSHIYDQLKRHSKKTALSDINILPMPEDPIEINFVNESEKIIVNSIDDILNNLDYYETQLSTNELIEDDENIILPNNTIKASEVINESNATDNDVIIDQETSLHLVKANQDIYKMLKKVNKSVSLGGGYFVQLAITKSEKDARNIWSHISRKYSNVLLTNEPTFKKINREDGRVYFLIMAGPYPNQYKAKLVCESLKKSKQSCIIMK